MPEKISSELVEPEEQKAAVIDFNPLDEPVNEKPYTIPNVNTTGVNMSAPIEEPRFTPPPIDKIKRDAPKPPPREPMNPEMKHLGKKDTEMAAGYAAKLVMQGYEWIEWCLAGRSGAAASGGWVRPGRCLAKPPGPRALRLCHA